MPYANVDDTAIYYEVHGDDGPPLLLAHGFFGNHATWFQQLPFLSKHYRVVTFDLRGFGLTADPDGKGLAAAPSDINSLLNALAIDQVALVGHSMGGNACVSFTVGHPERVNALVLADSLGGVVLPPDLRTVQETQNEAIKDLSPRERLLSGSFPDREPALTELFFQLVSFNGRRQAPAVPNAPRREPVTFDVLLEAIAGKPLLLLVGAEDRVQTIDLVRSVSTRIPNAALRVAPGAAHSLYFEQPEMFNTEVHEFLKPNLFLGGREPPL